MPKPDDVKARLPSALKKQIKIAAVQNGRSMNAEIVARLEQSFELSAAERARAAELLDQIKAILNGSG